MKALVRVALCFFPLLLSGHAIGQALQPSDPASVGMDAAKLEQVTARLQQHIDDGDIPGAVAAVARDGKLVYFESLGRYDLENDRDMRPDTLFRIYSMTRQVTSVAVLQQYDRGRFQFDDPISMYLPEFADQRVLLDPGSTDISQTRERVGDITVAHLLTHTSGLGPRSSALYRENNVRDKSISLDEMTSNA
ncbi:MAG: beta-lactamase family protein, partial [Gammaproteobacteria bacterium]|nr:beta-lactamase family protein [Gammaproteobacteria bacterium]